MKVLVISAAFPPLRSGGSDFAFWLCRHLAEAGQEVEVLTSRVAGAAREEQFRVWPVMRRWAWAELPRLLRHVRRCRPDVVNLHYHGEVYRNHPMVTFVPGLLKQSRPGVRVVTLFEEPAPVRVKQMPWSGRVLRKLFVKALVRTPYDYHFGTLLHASDRIVVLCEAHRAGLAGHLPGVEGKCVLIPPSPNLRLCPAANGEARREGRRRLGVGPDEFLLIYYGYLYPTKGLETLLEAFRLVLHGRPDARLVLVGGGNEVAERALDRPRYVDELKELAGRLGVADRLVWTGYCPPESELGSLYLKSADACALPFDRGAHLNNSSLAAVSVHGLPIITTRAAVVESAFVDGHNLLLCPPKDPAALAQAVLAVARDGGLARRLGEGAGEMAREWFAWEKTVERTLAAFGVPAGRVPEEALVVRS